MAAPDLDLLTFWVADADLMSADDFIGYYCLPVNSIQSSILIIKDNQVDIREGFRFIPVQDKKGHQYEKTSLLVHFRWA